MNTIFFTKEGRDAYEGSLYSRYLKILFIIISFCIYVLVLTYINIIHICVLLRIYYINNKT